MDDYPNSGDNLSDNAPWHPQTPEERQKTEEEERNKVTSSIGVINEVMEWLEANVALFGDTDSLAVDEATDPQAALIAMVVSKKLKAAFKSKARQFQTDFAKHFDAVAKAEEAASEDTPE